MATCNIHSGENRIEGRIINFMNQIINPTELELPYCPLPRPGEKVVYYSDARPIIGELRGHDQKGRAIIANQFGNFDTRIYEVIRPHDPMRRHNPNWHHLPTQACIYRPTVEQEKLFEKLLECNLFTSIIFSQISVDLHY